MTEENVEAAINARRILRTAQNSVDAVSQGNLNIVIVVVDQ